MTAIHRVRIAGIMRNRRFRVPATGTESTIQITEERSIHPINRGSFLEMAAPPIPRLENRVPCTPDRVMSPDVDEWITKKCSHQSKNISARRITNGFFVHLNVISYTINVLEKNKHVINVSVSRAHMALRLRI